MLSARPKWAPSPCVQEEEPKITGLFERASSSKIIAVLCGASRFISRKKVSHDLWYPIHSAYLQAYVLARDLQVQAAGKYAALLVHEYKASVHYAQLRGN